LDVSLLLVPYHAGDERQGSSAGPERFVEAGAVGLLARRGNDVSLERIERGAPFRDTASSAAEVNKRLAAAVRNANDAGRLPLVLSGSCNSAMGVLAGFEHSRCAAVWLDAHADFNTPETAASGFFPGMSLAVVTGHCYANYWGQIGENTPLREELVGLFGVRDLWPEAERERLERSAIEAVPWRDGEPQRDVAATIDRLATRAEDVYLHIDFDGFAPEIAPGVVDEPVPGGLAQAQAELIIRETANCLRLRGVTLATYTPARDEDSKTLRLGLRLVEVIGECLAPTP
jgi:arginase